MPRRPYSSPREKRRNTKPDRPEFLAFVPAKDPDREHIAQLYNGGHILPMQARRLRKIIKELNDRQMEALRLYEPLPKQHDFHRCDAKIRMNRGSNRAGKSQCSGAEIAWAATGTHPYLAYPKENGKIYCVGWDLRHVGQVMWPMIGKPGAYKVIRDEQTMQWRAVRPWQEYDAAYREKWRDAPPFLPMRMIKGGYSGISWESRKDEIPSTVTMVNGWKIHFAGSKGAPQQGIKLDLAWIDEEIENQKWYDEMVSRASDRRVRVIWSATPLAGTEKLYELHQKANSLDADGSVMEFILTIDDNPYIPQKEKDAFKAALSPEDIKVRYYGHFAMAGFNRYPEYSPEVHTINSFEIPADWTHYMVVDPGRQVCAVLFAALPPSYKNGKPQPYEIHVYDELYLKNCTADEFGKQVALRMGHRRNGFESFIIDHQYGRVSDAGMGKTIESQYSDALKKYGVSSHRTGVGFMHGSSDREGRQEMLRHMLIIRGETGTPPIRIHIDKCPMLNWEMQNQFFERDSRGRVTDRRKRNAQDHACDCLEYLVASSPRWVEPRRKSAWTGASFALKYLKRKQERDRQDEPNSVRLGPPG